MKRGFTLAEVLITLAIIGIVAALTIPSVISNYQQQEFKTGLKKAVSVLNEAIQTNIAQDGETPYENEELFSYLQRHMAVLKSAVYPHEIAIYNHNKTFYTTDGMRFEFPQPYTGMDVRLHESGKTIMETRMTPLLVGPVINGKCGSYGVHENSNTQTGPCILIVDVNGDKKPSPKYITNNSEYSSNGYDLLYFFPSVSDKKVTDIFTIMITDEKAIPFGVVAQRAMYSKGAF